MEPFTAVKHLPSSSPHNTSRVVGTLNGNHSLVWHQKAFEGIVLCSLGVEKGIRPAFQSRCVRRMQCYRKVVVSAYVSPAHGKHRELT